MPTQTDMREATCATANSFTKLTGDGQGGTLQDITAPSWANSIKHIAVSAGVDGAAVSGNILVSLRGATKYGDQIIGMGASGQLSTVSVSMAVLEEDVDIPVIPGKALELWGCFAYATTSGTPELGVEVTFSEKAGNHLYVTRQAALATVDVWATLNTENGTTTVNDHITQGSKLVQLMCSVGVIPTTQETNAFYFRVQGIGGSIAGNEHTFTGPSFVTGDGTLADSYICGNVRKDVDIACKPGTVRVQGVVSGVASTADPEMAVTLVYQV